MFASTYPAGGGTAFDISVGVKVWRQLAFGVGVSLFSRQDELQVTAQLPHSFHFDQPRRIVQHGCACYDWSAILSPGSWAFHWAITQTRSHPSYRPP